MRAHVSITLGLWCLLPILPSPSWAEPSSTGPAPSVALSWVRLPGAEACIGAAELARSVEGRLGRRVLVSPAEADLSIEGRVEPVGEGPDHFLATVVVADGDGSIVGERSLESGREQECRSLDEPLVLVIAITMDPDSALDLRAEAAVPPDSSGDVIDELANDGLAANPGAEPIEAEPAPPELVEPRRRSLPTTPPDNDAQSADSGPARPRPGLLQEAAGFASFQVGLGHLPGVPLGVGLTFVLDFPMLPPIELTAGSFLSAVASQGSATARFDQIVGRLAVCAPWGPAIVRLHGCGGLEAGVALVQGQGLDLPDRHARPVVDLVAGIRLYYRPVGRLVLRASATLLVPLFRDSFIYTDENNEIRELFEPRALGGAAEIGIGIDLD